MLICEDNPADLRLIREALLLTSIKNQLRVTRDGEKAIEFMDGIDRDRESPVVHLLILDLNLPRTRGAEVLAHLRNSKRCRDAAVLVVSSSDSVKEQREVFALGAGAYFRKPSSYEDYMKLSSVITNLVNPAI